VTSASAAPRIGLVVDHPARDLPGLVLTAAELCRRGAVCHFIPANLSWREVWALAPDFVLLNYLRTSNQGLGRGLATAGIPFGVLDTEGGVWPEPASYAELLWQDRSLLRRTACVCLWGDRMAEYLTGEGYFGADQVSVTGCPRFDLYHPAWRSILGSNGTSAAGGRPRILLNTNFSTRNPRFTTVEKKIETSRTNFGWTDERIFELLRMEEAAIEEIIRLGAALADRFPEADILLRPHPFEDPTWYRRELSSRSNIVVDGDGPVQPAIYGATVVVQRSCTTGIEAGLADTPTLSPQWVPAPLLMPVAEAVSVPCASMAELGDAVEAILRGRYRASPELKASIERVTRDWFHAADGNAHCRVAEAVLRATQSGRRPDLGRCDAYLYGHDLEGRPLRGLRAAAGALRRWLGRSPDWSLTSWSPAPPEWWLSTAKRFTASDVQSLADRVRAAWPAARALPRLSAVAARDRGEFRHGYHGYSITLARTGEA
jgi:surface carbohydrate biosynthesis protein